MRASIAALFLILGSSMVSSEGLPEFGVTNFPQIRQQKFPLPSPRPKSGDALSSHHMLVQAGNGSLIGYAYIKLTKQDPNSYQLPFGTFLAAAGIFVALEGDKVIQWYVNLL